MMMVSKNLTRTLLCMVIFHFISFGNAQSVPVMMHEPLSVAMQATGAEVNKAYIIGNATISVEDSTIDGLKKIVKESAHMLGLEKGKYEIEEKMDDPRFGVGLFYGDENMQIMIWARISEEAAEKEYANLTVKIVERMPQEKDIVERRNTISTVFQNFAVAPRISTCLEGYLDGRLRKDEWGFYLRDAFDAIGADIHTTTDGGAYMSYTGYSPLIFDKGIVVSNDRVNINMAVRYHSFDQRTYFVIGSPIIAVEY